MARRGRDRAPEVEDAPADSIRLDRWLCHARVFKTRTMAAERIAAGGVRINGAPCRKPGHEVKVGDVVTAAAPGGVRSSTRLALPSAVTSSSRHSAASLASVLSRVIPLAGARSAPARGIA